MFFETIALLFTTGCLATIVAFAITNDNAGHRDTTKGTDYSEQKQREVERYYWKASFVVSCLSVALTAVAFIGAVAGVYVAYGAYVEAGRQAKAAEDQVEVARETEKKQLRAYVFVNDFELKDDTIKIKIKNEGQTAAFNVTYWWNAKAFDYPVTNKDVLHFKDTVPGFSVDLGPQDERDLNPLNEESDALTAMDVALAKAGKAEIYVWGMVKYRDIFVRCQNTQFASKYFKGEWYIVKGGNAVNDPVDKEGCSADRDPKTTYVTDDIYLADRR